MEPPSLTVSDISYRVPAQTSMRYRYYPDQLLDTNEAGLAILRAGEALATRWFPCVSGRWAIGYGTKEWILPGVSRALLSGPISKAEAEGLLQRSLIQVFEPAIERSVRVPLTQNQFSTLVAFAYGVGLHALLASRLLRRLNRWDYEGTAMEFERWIYAGGRVERGLVLRREAERRLFLTDDDHLPALELNRLEPLTPLVVRPSKAGLLERVRIHTSFFSLRG